MSDRASPDSSQFFTLSGKIKTLRRPPGSSALAMVHEAELQALVAGWPWVKGQPGLVLEDEPIFWLQDGGARADLMGISARGRRVAAELVLEPFAQRKAALRSLARGLCFLVQQTQAIAAHAAFDVDEQAPWLAVIVGDGAVFPRDGKQLKTLAKDFRHLCQVQQPSWPIKKQGGGKEDRITPAWLIEQASRIELHAVGIERRVEAGAALIHVARYRLI